MSLKSLSSVLSERRKVIRSPICVLVGHLMMSLVFACATTGRQPLASGEVRLLSMDAVGAGVEANTSFAVNIFFEAAGQPEMKRACFYDSGEGPYCLDVSDGSYLTFGTRRAFQVFLPGLRVGSHRVECYAEYVRDGETRKTNVVFTQIMAGTHQ